MQKNHVALSLRLVLLISVAVSALLVGGSVRLPTPSATAHAQGAIPIQHIVFLVKENHSFDQMFGLFPGANGTTTGVIKLANGQTQTIPLNAAPDKPVNYCHLFNCAATDYDNGAMDAFNKTDNGCRNPPYLCYQENSQSTIPNYWAYAQFG